MSEWEAAGQSDEWYTPAYIFDALGTIFDMDVAAPADRICHVPCRKKLTSRGLEKSWDGFVWMNPPFGARNGLVPWLQKFIGHGNGIALTPDRTSAPWFQSLSRHVDMMLFVGPKVKFERPDGTIGKSPGSGTVLHGIGNDACDALERAVPTLGFLMFPGRRR